MRYEERGQGYRDVEKFGKHCPRIMFSFRYAIVNTLHKGDNKDDDDDDDKINNNNNNNNNNNSLVRVGVFDIATRYGLDGPRIESRWGRDFSHLPRPSLGPPSLL